MPPLAIAGAGMAIGGGLSYLGSRQQASAQQGVAEAQLWQQNKDRELAIKAAQPSTQELEQINRQISMQERALGRQEQLLNSIDPALMEAGQQALQMLRGQESAALNPIRAQRERQKQELLNRLRNQLGTGAEASTAGTQAMNQFDEQTTGLLTNAQLSSMGDLLRISSGNRPNPYGGVEASNMTLGAIRSPGERMVSAIRGTPIPGSGASFVGAARRGAATQELGEQLSKGTGTLAGML